MGMVAATPQSTVFGCFAGVPIGMMIGTMIGAMTEQQSSSAGGKAYDPEKASAPNNSLAGAGIGAGIGFFAWIVWELASGFIGSSSWGISILAPVGLMIVGVLGGAMSGALLGAMTGQRANDGD
jgi:hypothetical protein